MYTYLYIATESADSADLYIATETYLFGIHFQSHAHILPLNKKRRSVKGSAEHHSHLLNNARDTSCRLQV